MTNHNFFKVYGVCALCTTAFVGAKLLFFGPRTWEMLFATVFWGFAGLMFLRMSKNQRLR